MVKLLLILHTINALQYQLLSTVSQSTNLLKSSEKFPLANAYASQYYIKLQLGTPSREFILALDTESPFTWIPSVTCNCHSSLRYSSNGTCKALSIETEYTIGKISGSLCSDQFFFKSFNVTLPFLLVHNETGLNWMVTDGFLGLGLDSGMNSSVIDLLFSTGQIRKRLFSVFISKEETYLPSELSLGKFEADDYSDSDGILVNMTGAQWKTTISYYSYVNVVNYSVEVLFSPGFVGIFAPQKEFLDIFLNVSQMLNCSKFLMFFKCVGEEKMLPSLNFTYNRQNLTIHPQSYVYRTENSVIVLIGGHNKSYWVLGQPLFKEYFSVFDMEQKSISFYKVSKKSGISGLIYVVVSIFLVVVIFVPFLVYCITKKNQNPDLTQSLIN